MRLVSAIVASVAALAMSPASAYAEAVGPVSRVDDVPSDYENEEFTDNLIVENLPSQPEGPTVRGRRALLLSTRFRTSSAASSSPFRPDAS